MLPRSIPSEPRRLVVSKQSTRSCEVKVGLRVRLGASRRVWEVVAVAEAGFYYRHPQAHPSYSELNPPKFHRFDDVKVVEP